MELLRIIACMDNYIIQVLWVKF